MIGRRLFILLAPGLFLIACQGPPLRDQSTVFRYNESAGISSLDPAFARNQANIWACNQLYNGLVQLDRNLQVQPALARRWEVFDSGRLYRFYLRPQVFFHRDSCFGPQETRSVKAQDFVFSLERLRNTELAAPGAWVLQRVSRIVALNDSVLEIGLKAPFPPFLSLLSMQYCAVVPYEAVERYGSDFGRRPVGTGPFAFKLWVENEKLVLRRHPHYFERDSTGQALPYLEAVSVSFVPDKQTAFLEFIKGNLDLLSGLDASYKDELLDVQGQLRPRLAKRFKMYRQPYLNVEYLGFCLADTAGKPWADRRVRQAINLCFDRSKMLRYLRNGVGKPAVRGMIPPGLPGYPDQSNYGYDYDPERAANLLAEAGFPGGEGLSEIPLMTNDSYRDLCEYIQREAEALGIPLKVEVSPPATLRQAMATGKADFFRGSWIADYPDAENYLSLFYSPNAAPNGPNYTQFKDRLYDRWYRLAQSLQAERQRHRYYRQMDSLMMAEAPVVPLYYDQVLRFYPHQVQGLEGNALNLLDLRRVQKQRD